MAVHLSGVRLVVHGTHERLDVAGYADRARGEPWGRDTRTPAASFSKQFAAACALVLAAPGTLTLDDPVGAHLPDADPRWRTVRVRHLVTHTSGREHWDGRPGFAASDPGLEPARLRLLLEAPLRQAPGAEFHDSSPGYLVLSAVLSAAAGQPYRELVELLVIDPLGLHGTSVGVARPGPRALGYRGGTPVDSWDPARMSGTGDVWTTAPDIARFVAALHGGSLLPRAVLAELHVPLPVSPGARLRAHAYGAGHVLGTVDGQPARLHPGDDPGHQVLALWYPQTATTVVVVSNDEEDDLATIALNDRTTR